MSMSEFAYKEILKHLVAFNTVSDQSNLPMVDYLASFLADCGFDVQKYYNCDNTKANLIARIGPDTAGGILLSGHTDVVPVDGQPWIHSPFELVEQNEWLIGRGTADMKGFIAVVCDVVAQVDLQQLPYPLYLVFTYDEEIGCLGAKALQEQLQMLAPHIDFAIIGEPTNFSLVNAHKGIQTHRTHFTGKPAHSSCPHLGRSAIMATADFLQKLPQHLPQNEDQRFMPSTMTFNAGIIKGGNALNIIAEHCQLDWECRPLPGMDERYIQEIIEECAKEVAFESQVEVYHETVSSVPSLDNVGYHSIVTALKPYLANDITVTTAPFVTEAGIFQQVSIPTLVFGPGELEQAHQPNECVSLDAMNRYRQFLMGLIQGYRQDALPQ